MTQYVTSTDKLQALLGQRAEGRAPVDLLVEAERLKFSESEIAVLRRLYTRDMQQSLAKTPQRSG